MRKALLEGDRKAVVPTADAIGCFIHPCRTSYSDGDSEVDRRRKRADLVPARIVNRVREISGRRGSVQIRGPIKVHAVAPHAGDRQHHVFADLPGHGERSLLGIRRLQTGFRKLKAGCGDTRARRYRAQRIREHRTRRQLGRVCVGQRDRGLEQPLSDQGIVHQAGNQTREVGAESAAHHGFGVQAIGDAETRREVQAAGVDVAGLRPVGIDDGRLRREGFFIARAQRQCQAVGDAPLVFKIKPDLLDGIVDRRRPESLRISRPVFRAGGCAAIVESESRWRQVRIGAKTIGKRVHQIGGPGEIDAELEDVFSLAPA